ncbi:Hypothetical protein PMT_2387 [Prochlorococcus marinus str. MIT 9313]|uniref:Uncharacterized protein n=1 Tax=Prochlorococcus marinus (strain MIT 9313) TaxID=74547 RepID=B9ER93_PROMM|nr:Hypothetical protein PMT_2387 [Prochlorococcus marinus str. MIT 9313]
MINALASKRLDFRLGNVDSSLRAESFKRAGEPFLGSKCQRRSALIAGY